MATLRPTDYFEAALDLLAVGGARLVTIDNLCDRLAVTKGSFYHHFDNRRTFVRQTLLYWEEAYGRSLVSEALGVADARQRLALLEQLSIALNHDAERAIRALAGADPFADQVRQRVDDGRLGVLRLTLAEAGLESEHATRLADVGLALLIGIQQTGGAVDRHRVCNVLGQYRRWVEGEVAARTTTTA